LPSARSNIVPFHPSVWLAANVDPTGHRHSDRESATAAIARDHARPRRLGRPGQRTLVWQRPMARDDDRRGDNHYCGYNYRAPPVYYGTPYNYGYQPPPVYYDNTRGFTIRIF
jgi:hypothetical protein